MQSTKNKKIARKTLRDPTRRRVQKGLEESARESHVRSWVYCLHAAISNLQLYFASRWVGRWADRSTSQLAGQRMNDAETESSLRATLYEITHGWSPLKCFTWVQLPFIVPFDFQACCMKRELVKVRVPAIYILWAACLACFGSTAKLVPYCFLLFGFLFLEANKAWLGTYLSYWRHVAAAGVLEW